MSRSLAQNRSWWWLTLVCLVSFSCATQPQPTTSSGQGSKPVASTEAQQNMRAQSKNFDKTVWEGALIGAGAGLAWSVLSHDDIKTTVIKTITTTAAGALAGKYIASKQKQYANREDQLNSMIDDVQKKNRETEDFITTVQQVVEEDKQKLAELDSQQEQEIIAEAELKRQRQQVAEDKKVIDQAIEGAREQLAMFEESGKVYSAKNPDVNTADYSKEVTGFREHINALDDLADELKAA